MKNLIHCTVLIFIVACKVSPVAYAYNPEQVALFKQTKICEGCDLNLLNATPHTLGHSDFENANLNGAYFYGSAFEQLHFKNLQAREINAVGFMLHDNDLSGADFSYSDIAKLKVTRWNRGDYINFTGAFLSGSDFSYTEFLAPNFYQAYLKNASLYRVIWPQANLAYAVLQSADLTFAKFQHANLEGANFSGAVLSHADLSGANLLNSNITPEQLKQAKTICEAILPDGSFGPCRAHTL
jgi:uncharacterized protein YjbI with pentapeptide repeats